MIDILTVKVTSTSGYSEYMRSGDNASFGTILCEKVALRIDQRRVVFWLNQDEVESDL